MNYNINTCISSNLKALRKMHQYTQEYLASVLHVGRSTYAQYETCQRVPDHDILIRLSEIYNVGIDVIYERNINTFYRKVYFEKSCEDAQLIYMYRMLNAYDKGRVFSYMETLYNYELKNLNRESLSHEKR